MGVREDTDQIKSFWQEDRSFQLNQSQEKVDECLRGWKKAVALVLPELAGKLNGLAVRVPTPNVSIVDVVVTVEKAGVTVSDVNEALKEASETTLSGILGYSDLPLVSSDYNGCPLSSTVDAATTYVVDNMVKVLSWYDNETGYSHRMVDLAAMVGALSLKSSGFPERVEQMIM